MKSLFKSVLLIVLPVHSDMKILSSLKLLLSLFSLKASEWYTNSVHYWPFEDISNGTAKDYAGSNDGRIKGDFNTVSGLVGSALELKGNETYVDFGVLPSSCLNRPATCRSGFTIAFWMKIPNFQGNKIILQLGQHRFSRGFTLWTRRGLKKNVGFSVNTLHRKYDWMQDWYNDHWNHVALKWDNNTGILSIYLNCTIVKVINESEKATPLDDDKASRLILGASHAKRKNMRLMIDEFAIWNRTVSDDTLCKAFQIRSGWWVPLLRSSAQWKLNPNKLCCWQKLKAVGFQFPQKKVLIIVSNQREVDESWLWAFNMWEWVMLKSRWMHSQNDFSFTMKFWMDHCWVFLFMNFNSFVIWETSRSIRISSIMLETEAEDQQYSTDSLIH